MSSWKDDYACKPIESCCCCTPADVSVEIGSPIVFATMTVFQKSRSMVYEHVPFCIQDGQWSFDLTGITPTEAP